MIWVKVNGIDRWVNLSRATRIRVFESGTRRRGRHAVSITAAGSYEEEWGRDLKMDLETARIVGRLFRALASYPIGTTFAPVVQVNGLDLPADVARRITETIDIPKLEPPS